MASSSSAGNATGQAQMSPQLMPIECTLDQMEVIVLDNGSGSIKVGFCGEDMPRGVFPNVMGLVKEEPKEDDHDANAPLKVHTHFGDDALQQVADAGQRGELKYPLKRGAIVDREVLERTWEHALHSVMHVEWEDLKVLVADSPANAMGAMALGASLTAVLGQAGGDTPGTSAAGGSDREWVAEIMFDKFKVRSLAIMNSAVLSLFSTGRSRGLVVECGHGTTHAVPVFEGFALPYATFRMDLGGADVTDHLTRLFTKHPDLKHHAKHAHPRPMRALKEKLAEVAPESLHHQLTLMDPADAERRSFELPDGTIVQLDQATRYGAAEPMFGGQKTSVQAIVQRALDCCDRDFRQDLVRSVVLAGGTAMLPGFSQRLRYELSKTLPQDVHRQLELVSDPSRKYSAWIGGSMFASMSTFQHMLVTKQEFEEGRADLHGLIAKKSW